MKTKIIILTLLAVSFSKSADSVDVVFRYQIGGKSAVYLVGEFNGWNNSTWPMTNIGGNTWARTARLAIGGNPTPPLHGVPGAWQYKFYYLNASPWPNDPLNHHVNPSDNDNSFIITKDPTIYQLIPNQRNPIVKTSLPTISSYIFPKVGTLVDTSAISLQIDEALYTGLGRFYNFTTQQLIFTPPEPLANGNHIVILNTGTNHDTVNFSSYGGYIQLLNQFPFTTLKSTWTLNGTVDDSTISSTKIVRNGIDTFNVTVANKLFSYTANLLEGSNTFIAIADSLGVQKISSPVVFNRKIIHSPNANITLSPSGDNIVFDGALSSDPDDGQTNNLLFYWLEDLNNPVLIPGVNGSAIKTFTVPRPTIVGDYFYSLIVTDTTGLRDTTRNYFTINKDGSIKIPSLASNPDWAQKARVYFLFPKAFSSAGTLNAASLKLQYIKDMGFNVIWLMPVMKNAYPIDNGFGPGYNITDFYNVAPEYGTNQDLKNFISEAHTKGIRIILDITPNHSSKYHPWADNARTFKTNSFYWNWYQHQDIPHNTNGLGESADADSFWHYDGWDQLPNFNWTDIDMQAEMINVYKYWVSNFGLDGFRFDVYWGLHRRYGEQYMGKPVRAALKHIKPDILLLAEDDGTGPGTETIYADYSTMGITGGVDASYDFKLYFNQIRNFGFSSSAITNLHNEIDNGGYYPGENALYMRFMESQDEDRIYYTDPNPSTYYNVDPTIAFKKTMPMASILFTAPGFPMLWNGQEIGWGYGISGSKINRNRSVIDWNFQGKNILTPHYQKLANIRGQFPAFTQHKRDTNHDGYVNSSDSTDFLRISSSNNWMYAFTRPYRGQNGLTVVNIANSNQSTYLNLTNSYNLNFNGGIQPSVNYYLNNLYDNTYQQVSGTNLDSVFVDLPAYGTAIYTVSLTRDSVIIDNPLSVEERKPELPVEFGLMQNYPNPFNPSTNISYELPKTSYVSLKVYDVLGREVTTLVDEVKQAGEHTVQWDASNHPSGVYFYRMTVERYSNVQKMILIR